MVDTVFLFVSSATTADRFYRIDRAQVSLILPKSASLDVICLSLDVNIRYVRGLTRWGQVTWTVSDTPPVRWLHTELSSTCTPTLTAHSDFKRSGSCVCRSSLSLWFTQGHRFFNQKKYRNVFFFYISKYIGFNENKIMIQLVTILSLIIIIMMH